MLAEPGIRSNLRELCLVEPALRDTLSPAAGSRQVLSLDDLIRGETEIKADMVLGVVAGTAEYFLERIDDLWDWIREHPEYDLQFIVFSERRLTRDGLAPVPAEYVHLILPRSFAQ